MAIVVLSEAGAPALDLGAASGEPSLMIANTRCGTTGGLISATLLLIGCQAQFGVNAGARASGQPTAQTTAQADAHTENQAASPTESRVESQSTASAPPTEPLAAQPLEAPPAVVVDPAQIAGTPVVKVGINFEDLRGQGDADYNDAVLCFKGHFKVDGTQVVATETQRVIATTSSRSDCRHEVRVEVHHADGTRSAPVSFASRSGQEVPLDLRVGSRLEVFMHAVSGICPRDELNMHTASDCRVQLDQCNTTGD